MVKVRIKCRAKDVRARQPLEGEEQHVGNQEQLKRSYVWLPYTVDPRQGESSGMREKAPSSAHGARINAGNGMNELCGKAPDREVVGRNWLFAALATERRQYSVLAYR